MANIFEKNKTYLGDCLELMPQMESGMFDMILCDLPYGTTACKWDSIIPFEPLWEQYSRIIKPNGVIVLFGSEPFSSVLRMSNIKNYKYDWIWEKSHTANFAVAKYVPLRNHENISVFYKKKPTYNPQMVVGEMVNKRIGKKIAERVKESFLTNKPDILENVKNNKYYPKTIQFFKSGARCKSLHPTQKPVALFEYLIKTYTNENELVLDNCAGSGTTGEACYNTGRNYMQIEKEQKYFDLILEREKSFNKKDLYDGTLFETQM